MYKKHCKRPLLNMNIMKLKKKKGRESNLHREIYFITVRIDVYPDNRIIGNKI